MPGRGLARGRASAAGGWAALAAPGAGALAPALAATLRDFWGGDEGGFNDAAALYTVDA